MVKMYFYCGSEHLKTNGIFREKQRYLCNACGKQFICRKQLDVSMLSDDYLYENKLFCSFLLYTKFLRKQYDISRYSSFNTYCILKKDVVVTDATYWGRGFSVIVMKDSRIKRVLWRKFIYKK